MESESESKMKSKNDTNKKNKKPPNLLKNNNDNSREDVIRFIPLQFFKNTTKKYNKKIQYGTNKQKSKNFSESSRSSFSSISNDSLDSLDVEFQSDEDIKLKPIPINPNIDKCNQNENISIEDSVYLPKFTKRLQNKVSNLFSKSK
jgi:hypothetical protein